MSTSRGSHEERLHSIIQRGRSSAVAVLDHVASMKIVDKLARAQALNFFPHENTIAWRVPGQTAVSTTTPGTDIMLDSPAFRIHTNAIGQIAQHAGVPGDYVRAMATGSEPWQHKLISDVLNEHFSHSPEERRLLMRCVGYELRGAMSDRYKILRSEPIVEAFATAAKNLDAVPSGGYVSDVRIGLRALHPEPFYITPGDALCFGIQLRHSDFGRGTLSISVFVFRSTCLNTAVLKNALSMRHLGRKMADSMALSERTIHLNTLAAASEVVDIVEQALAPECRETIQAQLRKANDKEVEFLSYRDRIEKALGKGLCAKVEEAFNGEDIVDLPAGRSLWRLSNAVSWAAHEVEDQDKSADMERLAGSLLPGG